MGNAKPMRAVTCFAAGQPKFNHVKRSVVHRAPQKNYQGEQYHEGDAVCGRAVRCKSINWHDQSQPYDFKTKGLQHSFPEWPQHHVAQCLDLTAARSTPLHRWIVPSSRNIITPPSIGVSTAKDRNRFGKRYWSAGVFAVPKRECLGHPIVVYAKKMSQGSG